jgi:hypothetical protein
LITKIISGGQTGIDQAALLVASEMGIETEGWCPRGGLDENNRSLLGQYNLKEIPGLNLEESIPARTKRNIDDSDGTLIIVPSISDTHKIPDGTTLTIEYAKQKNKPCLIIAINDIDHNNSCHAKTIKNWIKEHNIKILNIAGPRESSHPGIGEAAASIFRRFIQALRETSR